MIAFNLETNEIYQEITLMIDGEKIGEAEVELTKKELSRLAIFEPYQDKGYGSKVVKELTKKYDLQSLWVKSDNEKAIHVYEKCGYKITKPKMYEMKRTETKHNLAKDIQSPTLPFHVLEKPEYVANVLGAEMPEDDED